MQDLKLTNHDMVPDKVQFHPGESQMVPSGWLLGTENWKITIAGEDEGRVEAVG